MVDKEQDQETTEIDTTAEKAKEIGKEIGVVDEKNPSDDMEDYEVVEESAPDDRIAKEREPRKERPQLTNKEKREQRKKRISEKFNEKDEEIARLSEENQQMKRWKNEVDGRLAGINQAEIQKAWNDTQAILNQAKKDYADSFTEGDGAKNVAALALMSDANDRLKQIQAISNQVNQRPQPAEKQEMQQSNAPDKVVVNKATAWAERNASWYKNDGKDVDSEIAKAISGVLANEGYDPKTDDFWDELDERLAERLPEKVTLQEYDDEDEPVVPKQVRRRTAPPVTNGSNRGDLRGKKTLTVPTAYLEKLKANGITDPARIKKIALERERILRESGN